MRLKKERPAEDRPISTRTSQSHNTRPAKPVKGSLSTLEFFSLVWPQKLLTHETLELRLRRRSDGAVHQEFFQSIPEFIDKAMSYAEEWDCYFGVGTRYGEHGKKVDVYRCGAVWGDFDNRKVANCRFDPRPSILVNSGGGVHAYWLMDKPQLMRGERWGPLEAINRGIAHKFGADINTVDIARVLRVPGTLNHKFNPPREVIAYAL